MIRRRKWGLSKRRSERSLRIADGRPSYRPYRDSAFELKWHVRKPPYRGKGVGDE